MNIKINNIQKADYWLNQTIKDCMNANEFLRTTFEFDAKMTHMINSGI